MNYYFKRISESLIFRNARMSDVPPIMTVIKAAVAQMIAEGKQQWDESYPGKRDTGKCPWLSLTKYC